jgi:hypothetical protein
MDKAVKVNGKRNEMMIGRFESFRLYDHGREIECKGNTMKMPHKGFSGGVKREWTDDKKPTPGGPVEDKGI